MEVRHPNEWQKTRTRSMNRWFSVLRTQRKYILWVVAIYCIRVQLKKENNEPATHQFFGGAMRARLAPETRATLAGTKTRAAQAQRSGILVPEGTEIIDIVTTYLPVVQSFKKGNIAAATRVPAHPPVPANPGFTRWCPPCKNRYSWLHIEPFRAGFSTDGVVGASWVGFCKKNPIFSYFFSIFPPHFILKKVVHLIVIYLYTRAPNI